MLAIATSLARRPRCLDRRPHDRLLRVWHQADVADGSQPCAETHGRRLESATCSSFHRACPRTHLPWKRAILRTTWGSIIRKAEWLGKGRTGCGLRCRSRKYSRRPVKWRIRRRRSPTRRADRQTPTTVDVPDIPDEPDDEDLDELEMTSGKKWKMKPTTWTTWTSRTMMNRPSPPTDAEPVLSSAGPDLDGLAVPPAPQDVEADVSGDELVMQLGHRRYRVRGLSKNLAFDQLKVNGLASTETGSMFVDTFDLYIARHRRQLRFKPLPNWASKSRPSRKIWAGCCSSWKNCRTSR